MTFEPRAGRYDLVWTASVPYPPQRCSRALGGDWWLTPSSPLPGSHCPVGFTRRTTP